MAQTKAEAKLMQQQEATADKAREAAKAQREANEKAYEASIEGQELPPSYAEQAKIDAERAAEAKADQEAAAKDMAETTERISSQPTSSGPSR